MNTFNKNLKSAATLAGAVAIVAMSCVSASAAPTITHRWTFDEYASQPYAVDTGNPGGVNAQTFGDPLMTSEVPSKVTGALQSFNSNGDGYFEIPNMTPNNFTFCAWIKTSAPGVSSNHWDDEAILHAEAPSWAMDYGFGISGDGKLLFGTGGFDANNNEGTDFELPGNTVVNDDVWHNVCVTRNGTTGVANLFVDGHNDGTATLGRGVLNDSDYIDIGYGQDGGSPFVGYIHDVRLYDSELSSQEVAVIANGDVATSTNNLANTGKDLTVPFMFGAVLIALGMVLRKASR